ncbi:MAG: hypothetical protein IJT16_05630 [Lachnospiraceae bacterium]|nr:hypothetical protein [Lachnospiraceae bacterium]
MKKAERFQVIMVLLVPKIVHLIMERDGLDEITACKVFYNSDLYARLEKEENDLWQHSAEELYEMYRSEKGSEQKGEYNNEQRGEFFDVLRRTV